MNSKKETQLVKLPDGQIVKARKRIGPFLIHRAPGCRWWWYVVTHMQSGRSAISTLRYSKAVKLARDLHAAGLDWNFDDMNAMPEVTAAVGGYIDWRHRCGRG